MIWISVSPEWFRTSSWASLLSACPPNSFFFNGSCFFYLPPKGTGFIDLSVDEGKKIEGEGSPKWSTSLSLSLLASDRCRLLRARLWDIESVDEFDYILGRIFDQIKSFDSPRIAVNFTRGKRSKWSPISTVNCPSACSFTSVLNLRKRIVEQQFLTVGNTNEYTLIYKPLADVPPSKHVSDHWHQQSDPSCISGREVSFRTTEQSFHL